MTKFRVDNCALCVDYRFKSGGRPHFLHAAMASMESRVHRERERERERAVILYYTVTLRNFPEALPLHLSPKIM